MKQQKFPSDMSTNRKKRSAGLNQAEETLREIEQNYMELVNNARSIILKMDTSGRFTFLNEFALNFFGFRSEEIIGKTALETIVPEKESTGRDLGKMVDDLYKDPDKYSVNINENIKKSGERVLIEWYNKALFDRKGRKTGHMAIGIDITERVKAEESLKESQEKLKSVLDAAVESIYMFDRHGRFTLTNSTGLKRFNKTEENELVGHKFSEFISDKELVRARQARLDQVFRTGQPLEFEDERNGMIFHHRFVPVFRGREIINIATFSTDITERKRADMKLFESQEKLRIALENGNIGIWEWNLTTGEVIWDERTEMIFGIEKGTFGKTLDAFQDLVNEEDLPHIRKAISDTLEKGIPLETMFRTKSRNGRTKYITSKALINKDQNGKPVTMTGVSLDVTALKKGTEQLVLKLNEELLRSNKELERFAYIASHDLQEPLRTITSFTQLLSNNYRDKLDERAGEYLDFVVEGASRMYELLNALLEYSRVQSKGKKFQRVNLEKVLITVKKNLDATIAETKATIRSGKLPNVFADENQMIMLFQNLIINGIKFSKDTPSIRITVGSEADRIKIGVRDEGIGIEPQYFEKIFQIFQRLNPRELYKGTGIGLAICKSIVERHGGEIWVESNPGKGSVFYFTLPRKI